MHLRMTTALALLVALGTLSPSLAVTAQASQDDELRKFEGEWLYVEDRSKGGDEHGPPMSVKFSLRVEKDAVVMPRSRGDERIALDGSTTEEKGETSVRRSRGEWKDGVLKYDIESVRVSDDKLIYQIKREFRITPDGLEVRLGTGDRQKVALYRHPDDIALPTPAKGSLADLKWLAGAWVGTRGKSSIEERWSPPLGGAMLGVSRTVSISRGKMVGFEFLRIIERDGTLVYIAQPGGRPPTEFVLTKIDKTRVVFDNPRHSFPQRIVYELTEDGLTASIGFVNGGKPRLFEFKSEGK